MIRALGTKRSRGIDKSDTVRVNEFRCKIIVISLFTPLTPWEHSPYALFCTASAQRLVEPINRMFSMAPWPWRCLTTWRLINEPR